MACIARRPVCGVPTSDVIPEPISRIGSIVGTIAGIAGGIAGGLKAAETVGGIAVGLGAAASGVIIAAIVGIAIIITIGMYNLDRCVGTNGLTECIAGVVEKVVQDFNSFTDELFPFTAMHDRIEVVVKSNYWDVVEDGGAKVFCTEEPTPRRSELMRCYFYTKRVCDAGTGSLVGAGVGAVGGLIIAAVAAAAIGCATIILCILALIVAALLAAVAALIGAFVGGQIGKAASGETTPEDNSGNTISVGDLITVNGNMVRREYDEGANVLWWVRSSSLSGRASESIPNNPFSYCEIDEEMAMDACPTRLI
ncbi:hypothetical protein [Galbibacter mesophilus]|uniref:hypothetical protein n=1 Tax=Galbibacter mesophilus TaxID=379069 RepID=UPI00191EB544|nr:hypothetical protein [Galbibacter mesophilus]MCM5663646.1 hypothetical protein [Galbibacter mesophilus]